MANRATIASDLCHFAVFRHHRFRDNFLPISGADCHVRSTCRFSIYANVLSGNSTRKSSLVFFFFFFFLFLAEQVALCQTNKLALIAIATCFSVRYAINLASFKKLDLKQKKKKESTFVWKTAVDDFKRAVRTIRQDDSNFVHTGHRTMVSFLRYFLSDLVMRGSVPSILHRLRRLPIRIPVISKNETKKKQKKKTRNG